MESRSHAIAAGIFVIVLLAAALGALWWFSDKSAVQREVLVISQGSVTGLNAQATVRYRGVRIGKVRDIRFDPAGSGAIHVGVAIDSDAPVTEKTRARLAYQGVTGQAYLQLDDAPGTLPLPQSGSVLRLPLQSSMLSESIDTGLATLQQVRDIAARLNTLIEAIDTRKVARTLDNVERLTGHAAVAASELPDAVARLKRLASDENIGRLSATLKSAAEASGKAPAVLEETRAVATSLRAVADRLDATLAKVDTQGLSATPGKINVLSEQIGQTVGNLDRLIRNLEESPQSLVFGRAPREAGPGEPGFGEKK